MRFGLDEESDDKSEKKNMEEANIEPQTEEASASSEEVVKGEKAYKRREFAMVIFHNIPETYPDHAHIECGYTITCDFVPTRSDWIGLYKVGWLSTKDYIYYDWVNIPSSYEAGKDAEGRVLFPSHKLPSDDGEFYQFCYVTSYGQIRGASTPFQFKRPSADDFVEIEDEETQMLVIRSKSVVMEETVKKLESEKNALLQMQHDLEMERDELVNKLYLLDKSLQEMEQENKHLSDQVKVDRQTISQLQQEAKDLIMVRDEIQQRADTVKRDRESIQDKVNRLDAEIDNMRYVVKKLQTEKDELEGENLKLKQGIDMYKQHFSKQETVDKESAQQIEELQIKLAKQESLVEHLKSTSESVKDELKQTQLLLSRQAEVSTADKENIDWLSEKIQNLEDKLSAADNVKQLLQEELHTYKEHNQKMAGDLEITTEENHALKHRYSCDRESLSAEAADLQAELEEKRKDFVSQQEQVQKLKEENTNLMRKLEEKEETSSTGSMQCLVMAQSTLKERYSKMEQSYTQYQSDSAKKHKEQKQQLKDMSREIEDLKERLTMGSNEYRNLYIENRKLVKKVEKLEKVKGRIHYQSPETEVLTLEQCQKSSVSEMSADEAAIETKLQNDLDDVCKELDLRQEKKLKYKLCLIEERKRVENLKLELKERDEEIEMLKKALIEVQNEKEVKVRSLENYMSDKDKTIDELNRKIRDTINLHDGPCKLHSSEGSGAASSLEKPKTSVEGNGYPPYMVYANPYHGHPHNTAMVYPQQSQTPPLVYPGANRPVMCPPQMPLIYPHPQSFIAPPAYQRPAETEEGQSAAASPPVPPPRTDLKKNIASDDAIPETEALDPPLQPLPPPMVPERLQSSKKAEIISVFGGAEGGNSMPSAPPMQDMKEDRFEDAPGEGMKICPVCSTTFSADISDSNFEEHVLGHVGRICPLCQGLLENCTDEDFQRHVNQHLDQPSFQPTDPMEFD